MSIWHDTGRMVQGSSKDRPLPLPKGEENAWEREFRLKAVYRAARNWKLRFDRENGRSSDKLKHTINENSNSCT